jgi:hypothetical protein
MSGKALNLFASLLQFSVCRGQLKAKWQSHLKKGLSVRREIIVRLVPRTLFLMPTLSIITGTTGWFLAKDLGLLDVPWPQFGWVAAALALVVLMTIQGLGYLLPTNLGLHSVAPTRSGPCQDQPDDAQLLFCRRHAGDDASADHRHHGPFRDWLVSLRPFQIGCRFLDPGQGLYEENGELGGILDLSTCVSDFFAFFAAFHERRRISSQRLVGTSGKSLAASRPR